jgi:hypothetical protein
MIVLVSYAEWRKYLLKVSMIAGYGIGLYGTTDNWIGPGAKKWR